MVKVTNIKYETYDIETNHKEFKKCIEYAKLINSNYKKLLPNKPKKSVTFEIHDTNSDFANMIRRFLQDEIPVYSMGLDDYDIQSDDEFILNDYIKRRIEYIPILQDLEKYDITKFNIHLFIENKTHSNITVYTRDLEILYDNKKYTGADLFSYNIPILELRSSKKININNIKIDKGMAKDDAGKYLLLSNLKYKILDGIPLSKTKYKTTGESSLNSNPRKFLFKLTNHRNIDPKKIMKLCLNEIYTKLNIILTEIKKIKDDDSEFISEIIKLETNDNFKLIYFINEYWTIANVISRYCYLEDNDIDFVCSSILHPTNEISLVKIKSKNYLKILINAINQIIKDIKIFQLIF